jgi:hypothetical protein
MNIRCGHVNTMISTTESGAALARGSRSPDPTSIRTTHDIHVNSGTSAGVEPKGRKGKEGKILDPPVLKTWLLPCAEYVLQASIIQ